MDFYQGNKSDRILMLLTCILLFFLFSSLGLSLCRVAEATGDKEDAKTGGEESSKKETTAVA